MVNEFDDEFFLDDEDIDEPGNGCQVCRADLPEDQLVEYEGIFMCEDCLDKERRRDEERYLETEFDDDGRWD